MDRRAFISALAGSLAAVPLGSTAQQAGRVYQVGFVTLAAGMPRGSLLTGFIGAMHELNYVEGRNLVVRLAAAEGKAERLPGLVADLVQAKVDVIITTSTAETLAAKSATATIPIVMTVVRDPVEKGLVASLARPGGNVTGMTSVIPGISEKYVELLHEVVPSTSRFAVVSSTDGPSPEIRRELEGTARQFGVTLSFTRIRVPDDIDPALGRAKKNGAGGIVAPLDAVTYRYRAQLMQLALKHRLPGIYWDRDYVEAGGLMSYGASLRDVGRRVAYFVDKILKGAKPGDLPVEQPTRFELVINLKTAKALGLTIPQSLLLRADEVIQ